MNTILTDKYREAYKPIIEHLFSMCPDMMARKYPEANVQQGFTYDMTKKLADTQKQFGQDAGTKILCVGSYEDTACETLKKEGYNITGIDPAINYDLNAFYQNSDEEFDIIFSTSVIEHVPDDEQFIDQICKLLKPGGYGVLTCDFKDGWKPGDPKPGEDFRLYTKEDLLIRLNTILRNNNCWLQGPPNYDFPPDFVYQVYTYSFATYTFRKNG